MKQKILIVVPAYNEGKNIVQVIAVLKKVVPYADVLVVNDGSKDDTSQAAKSTRKAIVIDMPINVGIGGAVQTGFIYAHRNHYDVAIQFDGDGQHKAEEIKTLLAPIQNNKADVVIGSRFCENRPGFKSSFARRIGIKIFEIVNLLLIRKHVTDNTSGFRAYNKKAIAFLAEHYPNDFPEPEAVIVLGRNGFRMQEVYTEMIERQGGQSSISGLKSAYYMIKVLLAIMISSIRPKITQG
jgi:glycosyltransferase involved in cell wall biosynthesis